MKFPKLHLVCSNDDLRPTMSHVKIDKEFTFASDAHILVRHKTLEIFKEDFVSSLPEGGIMIPRKAVSILCQKSTSKISLTDDKKQVQLHQMDGSVIIYKCFFDQQYPDANRIIPDKKDCQKLSEIGLSAGLLKQLSDGMGCDIPILVLRFFGASKAILCTSNHTDYNSAIGIIMPVMINE